MALIRFRLWLHVRFCLGLHLRFRHHRSPLSVPPPRGAHSSFYSPLFISLKSSLFLIFGSLLRSALPFLLLPKIFDFGELYCSLAADIICVFLPSPLSRIGRVAERLQFFSIYDYPASLLLCPLFVRYHRMDDAKRLSSGPLLLQS